jgi:hypothetical protein
MERVRYLSGSRFVGTLVALVALGMLAAAPAAAVPKAVVGFFGNPTGGNSPLSGEFAVIQGVAVNATGAGPADPGDIYVVDQQSNRIQRFSGAGQFERAWGRDVIRAGAEVNADLGNVAEICTQAPDCKAGVAGSLGGEFVAPRGIAVDQATGDVYIVERHNTTAQGVRVQKFTGDGEFVWVMGKDSIVDGSTSDPGGVTTTQVCTVASDCKATSTGALGGEFGVGGANPSSGGGTGIAVIPTGVAPLLNAGNVVVTDRGNQRVQEFTPNGTFVRAIGWDTITNGSPSDPGSATTFQICTVATDCKSGAAGSGVGQFGANAPNRVAVDSTGAIYAVENSSNFRVQKLTPQVGPPALSPAVVNPDIGGGSPALSLSGTASSSSPLDIAVGPSDHVFVLRAFAAGTGTPAASVSERRVVELTDTGALDETHGAQSGLLGAIDLAVDVDSELLYLTTAAPAAGTGQGVYVLDQPPPPPTVTLGVGGIGPHSAQLNGLVNPNGPGTEIGIRTRYHFEYREVGAPAWTVLSSPRDAGNGFSTLPVSETLSGLSADTAYEARLIASRPFSASTSTTTALETFATPGWRPDVDSVSVTDRQSTSVTLNARINPNGESTSYQFEYGTTAAYGAVIPDPAGDAGVGKASQIYSEIPVGLEPDTTYHYRVSATNANGSSVSQDRTFTTLPAITLPEARAYELVSPPDKVGGSGLGEWYQGVSSHGEAGVPAVIGDRFASEAYNGGSLVNGAFSYGTDWALGERTSLGWINKPAFNRPGGFGTSEFAKLVAIGPMSDDFSLMAVGASSPGQISIFSEQVEAWASGNGVSSAKAPALREWTSGRWEITAPTDPDHLNIAFDADGNNVDTAVAAGGGYALISGQLRGVAGSVDPTSVDFFGQPGDFVPAEGDNGNVYIDDVSAGLSDNFPGTGIRSLVNVCTGTGSARTMTPLVGDDGKLVTGPCPDASPGRPARLVSPRGASLWEGGAAPGHIADDGSRVFFMSPDHKNVANQAACSVSLITGTSCPPQVYVRQQNDDGSATVRWISRSEVPGQDAALLASAVFEGATPDGDKVFFRTASPLTPDDPNGGDVVPGGVRTGVANPASVDLYMYDFPDAPGADIGDGTLTRVSAGPTGFSDANVSTDSVSSTTSALRAFGSEGDRVYFTTAAPLAGVASAANGTITTAGGTVGQGSTRNLYLYDASQPAQVRWRFIAQLPAVGGLSGCAAKGSTANGTGLSGLGALPGVAADPSSNCARASGDGTQLKFFTDGRLTLDDPDAGSGDVYLYDAATDELVRISRPQRGATGSSYECVTRGAAAGARCHGDLMISAIKTVDPPDGSVFFESASQLVPEDLNNVYDVYQWRNGVLSLVSTGAVDAEDALYRGHDSTGANVYISTRDRLSWQDHDAVLDVYVARRGSDGIPEPPTPPTCDVLADTCRGGGAPPIGVPGPGTAELRGTDNADGGPRLRLGLNGLSSRARKKAAHSGVLTIAVRTSGAARIDAVAKAKIGKRNRQVARHSAEVDHAGRATLKLKLNRVARQRLRSGRALRISVSVSSPGAVARSMSIRLPGVGS